MISRRSMLAAPSGLFLLPLLVRAQDADIKAAQPELPREPLVVVTRDGLRHALRVEVATTPQQQTVGLMFRPSVPEDGGMLFDWGVERESQMWMRNTPASLDMVFIKGDGTVGAVAERTTPRSLAIIDSDGPVRATLELAAGTAERLGIRVGDHVEQRIFGKPAPG